ncbi:hypothetical protein ACOMHN_014612 [Nucella lapillus]
MTSLLFLSLWAEFFTELLDNAKRDMHEMFVKTYGLLYQQNSVIFADLFQDLRAYYKGKDRDLEDVMEGFFSRLLQKMFELLNGQYAFDDDYLSCVTERMNDLKPFGDVPGKLSLQIKRAFIAARTFVQGLAIGRDVILNVLEIPPTESCVRGLVKMTHCPKCRGLTNTKPCNNFCLNTMKGCLAHHAELNAVWNQYIDALKNLAKRLEGPFNIEAVVDPIDVKISNAIMNLQENSQQVSSKIFAGCGRPQPRMARKKRQSDISDASSGGGSASSSQGGVGGGGGEGGGGSSQPSFYNIGFSPKNRARPTTAAGTNLDRLVRDINEKVKPAKDFWVQLPYNICNDDETAASPSSEEDCWNGQDRARYIPDVQLDGVINQINNPEVEVDVSKSNTMFTRQLVQLRLITSRLQNAYNGEDVDWIDTEIEGVSGSGSGDHGGGSGSGSGFITEDNEGGIVDIDNVPPFKHLPDKPSGGTGSRPTRPGDKRPGGGRGGGRRPIDDRQDPKGSSVLHTASWTVVACLALAVGSLCRAAVF